MSTTVKIMVQPGQAVTFPGLCVYNQEPAVATWPIHKRIGRVTRTIAVPVSASTLALLQAFSPAEHRFRRLGQFAAAGGGGLALVTLGVGLPGIIPLPGRLLLGLAVALLLAFVVWRWFRRRSLDRADPAKQAALAAVVLESFSWRATTFRFTSDSYARQFQALNEPYLMPVEN